MAAAVTSGCGGRLAVAQEAQIASPAAQYAHHGLAVLQDAKATPGATDPQLTATKLCDPAFHTGTARNKMTQPQKRKVRVCRAYGITKACPGPLYEIDHLISIELGGANDDANLWPQPVDALGQIGFHTKDVVENRAHRAVCSGKLTLEQAQTGIRTDWFAFGVANGFLTPDGKTKLPKLVKAAAPK
jgi:hypothetical protein